MTNYDICTVNFNEVNGMGAFNGEVINFTNDESNAMPNLVRDVHDETNSVRTRLFNLKERL